LVKDSLYYIEFRYKLSSYSKYSVDRIGILLSDSLKTFNHDHALKVSPTISFVKDSALTPETGGWELAQAEYRAKGNERFLTIGNFSDNINTRTYYIRFRPEAEPMLAQSAYYYIDDVKVTPGFSEDAQIDLPPVFTGDNPELNTTYVLKNIQFGFNSYELMPESYYDLERVVAYMKSHPEISVELSGHTDSLGDNSYNETLSLNRARSAASYIVSKGIAKSRISSKGYGEEQPVRQGEDDASHELNRRVEIRFYR
jgi:outer membrane protein OmpA-like peptidoglycan-associated protein